MKASEEFAGSDGFPQQRSAQVVEAAITQNYRRRGVFNSADRSLFTVHRQTHLGCK
jgi:hypothetical protein